MIGSVNNMWWIVVVVYDLERVIMCPLDKLSIPMTELNSELYIVL